MKLWWNACHCDSTIPTPIVVTSTSMMNGKSGLGWIKVEAVMNASLSWWKASDAAEDQDRNLGVFLRREELFESLQ